MDITGYKRGSGKYRYRLNRGRFYPLLALFTILFLLFALYRFQGQDFYTGYKISEFNSSQLDIYFEAGYAQDVPWQILMAIDLAEDIPKEEVSLARSEGIGLHLQGITSIDDLPEKIKTYNNDAGFIRDINREIKRLKGIVKVYEEKVFPLGGLVYEYEDNYGQKRSFGGDRLHEGIDIMCDIGVPLLAVCDGTVEKKGWLELGGWRIGIRGRDGLYYYYAHLSAYEGDIKKGQRVKKGQIIGYAGDSGYGTEGTLGKFPPHLHFGMYERSDWLRQGEKAINPFPFLKAWERDRQ